VNDLEFKKLVYASRCVTVGRTDYNLQVNEWAAKRDTLILQMVDIPVLTETYLKRCSTPYENNPHITLVDPVPGTRLSNACEAAANGLYSIAEIASNFANKASKGKLPARFNKLRKDCEKDPSLPVAAALGDLQWYRKVRELRTEWVHYSSVFISEDSKGTVELGIRAFRRPSDKVEFQQSILFCAIPEFVGWIERALTTLDRFAGFVLDTFVVPSMPLDEHFLCCVVDENGFPKSHEDCGLVVESITVREFLKRGGIQAG
jgi:hypothetical protein